MQIILFISLYIFIHCIWSEEVSAFNKFIATMVLFGISLIIGFFAIKLIEALDKNQNEKMENLSGIIVPLITAIYFIYQATSGSFFATTSITLEAKRNTDNANEVVITANIERGDNWLVEILESKYQITEYPGNSTSDWKSIAFPSRIEGSTAILRLAPKEKHKQSLLINAKPLALLLLKLSTSQWAGLLRPKVFQRHLPLKMQLNE